MIGYVSRAKGHQNMDLREDIGIKILGGMVVLLFTLFVNAAWSTANEGRHLGETNSVRIQQLETRWESIQGDLLEIKQLLRRTSPAERAGGINR